MVYYAYLMKDQNFHRSQALDAKVLNHEDVSAEREMSSSISLDRQSANSAEALSNQIRHLYGGKK